MLSSRGGGAAREAVTAGGKTVYLPGFLESIKDTWVYSSAVLPSEVCNLHDRAGMVANGIKAEEAEAKGLTGAGHGRSQMW